MSWRDDIAGAPTSPAYETHEEAAKAFEGLTRDEYTLARVVASELADGTPEAMACIADADVNRAEREGRSVYDHATRGQGYGPQGQGSSRPVSTRRSPRPRHIRVALAVLRRAPGPLGYLAGAPARGISRGAERYFDPQAQEHAHAEWKAGRREYRNCPAAKIHEKWTYGLSWDRSNTAECGMVGKRRRALEWVGPISGVNPWRLALYRPATSRQDELFAELARVIESRGRYQPAPPLIDPEATMLVLGLIAAASVV